MQKEEHPTSFTAYDEQGNAHTITGTVTMARVRLDAHNQWSNWGVFSEVFTLDSQEVTRLDDSTFSTKTPPRTLSTAPPEASRT